MNEVLTRLQTYADTFGQLKNFSFEDCDYHEKENGLKDTWSAFDRRLQQRIGEQDTDEKLSVFIKITQDRLTDFADHVFDYYINVEEATSDLEVRMKTLFRDIENEVVRVLEFLKVNFSANYNFYGKVPKWVFYDSKDVLLKTSSIISGLQNKAVKNDLIEILKSFLDHYQFKNWHECLYYQRMSSTLNRFVESKATEDDTMRLIKLLIGYNFNPLTFYEFMLEFACSVVDKDDAYEDQEIKLLHLLKIIENIRPEITKGYNLEVQPIQESVGCSIRRELELITKLKQVEALTVLNGSGGKSSWYNFEVVSTIEELILMVKIMLAVRFIKTRYYANLYRFIERHIKTDRSMNASPQYMRNILAPGWIFSPKVIRQVRSWLAAMITYIDTHFADQLRILCVIWFLEDPIVLDLLAASPVH